MLNFDPHNGSLYAFRGRRGDLIKILWWDGQGLCLFCKRLERGKFIWPQAKDGSVALTAAQLSMLLEEIDWRAPVRRLDAGNGLLIRATKWLGAPAGRVGLTGLG